MGSGGASESPPGSGHRGLGASGEMAARSLGCGVGRLLGSLPGRAGPRRWPPRGVSALRRVASGPPGSAPAAAAAAAAVQAASYPTLRVQAAQQPAAFWGPLARDTLVWDTPYHTVWDCDFSSGKIAWFLGGQLNVSGEWAVGIQGAPNSAVQRGLRTQPAQPSRRIAAPWADIPSPRGSTTSPPAATLSLDLTFPAPARAGRDPARRRQLESPSCWPCPTGSSNGGLSSLTTGLHSPAKRKPGRSRGRHLGQAGVVGAGLSLMGMSLLLSPGPLPPPRRGRRQN